MFDEGRGVGPRRNGVYLDFADAIERLGEDVIRARYGNLFQMYERITGEDPYRVPMRIYPAPHYTMGGLWVDYDLMTTIPGLYAIGEANFSDHGANRLGACALMQGLADGYFILPVHDRRLPRAAARPGRSLDADGRRVQARPRPRSRERVDGYLSASGEHSVDWFHRELGQIMWEDCGMARNGRRPRARAGGDRRAARASSRTDVRVLGDASR